MINIVAIFESESLSTKYGIGTYLNMLTALAQCKNVKVGILARPMVKGCRLA